MAEKSRRELERELDFLRKRRLVDGLAAVLASLTRWGGMALCIYLGITRPFDALAGKTTAADIAVNVWTNLRAGDQSTWASVVPWGIAVVGVLFGLLQRKLRRDTIERLQGRIGALEKGADPGRSSSTLTPRGDTRKEDRL